MNRPHRVLLALTLLVLLVIPANIFSCSPMIENRFVNKKMPEVPQQPFVNGKLGILWPGFQRRYLTLAYRYLDHKPLSTEEIASLTKRMTPNVVPMGAPQPDTPITLWLKARSRALGLKEVQQVEIQPLKMSGFNGYPNCGDDAFTNATTTVEKRAQKFGVASDAIREWVVGQDTVFQNCGSPDDFKFYGPDQQRPNKVLYAPPPVKLDNALLKLDRQYQIAAANFYYGDLDAAAGGFQSIAHELDSPWRTIAPYLVARCYVRKATVDAADNTSFTPATMQAAEEQLRAILADKSLASDHPAAQSLLNYVEARLHPEQRLHAIAVELEHGVGSHMEADLFDYAYLLDHVLEQQANVPGFQDKVHDYKGPANPDDVDDLVKVETWRASAKKNDTFDDLTDWVLTFHLDSASNHEYRYDRWQATKSVPWLISALVSLDSADTHAAEILAAASSIAPDSPAYDTVLYHRVRLLEEQNHSDQARRLLDANWQRIEKQAPSDRNAFLAQRLAVAQNFQEFLQFALRTPLEMEDYIGKQSYYCFQGSCNRDKFTVSPPPARLQLDSVAVFNRDLPLSMLVQAATGTTLPPELRSELAARTWVRAAILDNTSVTRELEPQVLTAYPDFRPYFEQYDQADSPAARKFALVNMLLHFSGMQPFVNSGAMGSTIRSGIDSYVSWWCYDVGKMQEQRPYVSSMWSAVGSGVPPAVQVGPNSTVKIPAWISQPDLAQARKEVAAIESIGAAPMYFAPVVLDWAKSHPDDPRVPEALHYFVRSTRYGCVDKSVGPYSRRAFDLLHTKYPNSEWTKKTPYWYG